MLKKFVRVLSRVVFLTAAMIFSVNSMAFSAEGHEDKFPPKYMVKLGSLVTSAKDNRFGNNTAASVCAPGSDHGNYLK